MPVRGKIKLGFQSLLEAQFPEIYNIESEINSYYNLIDLLDETIEARKEVAKEEIRGIEKDIEGHISFEQYLYEYSHFFRFSSVTLKAMFLGIHSFFEGNLKLLCKIIHNYASDSENTFKDPQKDKIQAYISFLVKRFPAKERDMQENKSRRHYFNSIRNYMTHDSSIIDSNENRKKYDACNDDPNLKLWPYLSDTSTVVNNKYVIDIISSNFLKEYLVLIRPVFAVAIKESYSLAVKV